MVSPRLRGLWLVLLLLLASLAMYVTTRQDAERNAEPPLELAPAVEDAGTKGSETAQLEPIKVEMTAYTSAASQTDATPNLTASGAVAGPGTAAASRDLLERMPYGSQVEVVSVSGEGCGGWVPDTPLTVADTMNARIENHLDVWLETSEQALNWGRCNAEIKVMSNEQ